MPEINEVRKYVDFIKKKTKNKSILDIKILNGRYKTKGPFELFSEFKKELPLVVSDIKSKGKFLYIIFNNNYILFSTLGLSGGWTFYDKEKYEHPMSSDYINQEKVSSYFKIALNHLNVELVTEKGSLYFYDTLSFGTMKIIKDWKILEKKLAELGPDIMEEDTTLEVFKERLLLKKNLDKPIGNVLMNQKVLSGIGNYLRADILWLSEVSPFRKVRDLKEGELKEIFHNSKLLTWGEYDFDKAVSLGIIKKSMKMPRDYGRDFFIYKQNEDTHGNEVKKEELYEGSQKRFIYWVPKIQK